MKFWYFLLTTVLKPLQIRTFYLKKTHGIKEIHPNDFIFDLKAKKNDHFGSKLLKNPDRKRVTKKQI
jgi:hypothetical protein